MFVVGLKYSNTPRPFMQIPCLCLPTLKRTGCVMENMCSPPENLQHNSSKTNQCIAVNMFYVILYIYIFFIWTIMLDLPCYNSTFFAGEKYGLTRCTIGGFHIMYVTAQFIMWRVPLQMKISNDRVYFFKFPWFISHTDINHNWRLT